MLEDDAANLTCLVGIYHDLRYTTRLLRSLARLSQQLEH